MAPRRQAQAITPPPAGVHTGAQVLASVGTNPTDRPKARLALSSGRVFPHPAAALLGLFDLWKKQLKFRPRQ